MRERGEFASKDKLDQSGRRSLPDGFNISSSLPGAPAVSSCNPKNQMREFESAHSRTRF